MPLLHHGVQVIFLLDRVDAVLLIMSLPPYLVLRIWGLVRGLKFCCVPILMRECLRLVCLKILRIRWVYVLLVKVLVFGEVRSADMKFYQHEVHLWAEDRLQREFARRWLVLLHGFCSNCMSTGCISFGCAHPLLWIARRKGLKRVSSGSEQKRQRISFHSRRVATHHQLLKQEAYNVSSHEIGSCCLENV